MSEEELFRVIDGCLKQDRISQKMLYTAFYGYCLAICLRYAHSRDEAAEVMNRGFYKVFTRMETFDRTRPFKAWLARIMKNVSIDYYRANRRMAYTDDLDEVEHLSDGGGLTDQKLNYDDLLRMVQKLTPGYRTVFNLFAIEGYTHEEIGELLHISPGTSKSNLHKAREKLKQMIFDAELPALKINMPELAI